MKPTAKQTEKKPKIKQSETVMIKRSEIRFASYNPRKPDPVIVEEIKKNFKKVGYLGGIVFNKTTGNLVGGISVFRQWILFITILKTIMI